MSLPEDYDLVVLGSSGSAGPDVPAADETVAALIDSWRSGWRIGSIWLRNEQPARR